jgi:hypothetical protein
MNSIQSSPEAIHDWSTSFSQLQPFQFSYGLASYLAGTHVVRPFTATQ